jgi:hypothetical protein
MYDPTLFVLLALEGSLPAIVTLDVRPSVAGTPSAIARTGQPKAAIGVPVL